MFKKFDGIIVDEVICYEETVKRKRKILEDFVISFLVDVRLQRC